MSSGKYLEHYSCRYTSVTIAHNEYTYPIFYGQRNAPAFDRGGFFAWCPCAYLPSRPRGTVTAGDFGLIAPTTE